MMKFKEKRKRKYHNTKKSTVWFRLVSFMIYFIYFYLIIIIIIMINGRARHPEHYKLPRLRLLLMKNETEVAVLSAGYVILLLSG